MHENGKMPDLGKELLLFVGVSRRQQTGKEIFRN